MAALFTAAKISVLLALRKIIDLFINCIHQTSLPRRDSSRNSPRSMWVEGTRDEALRTSAQEASIRQVHCIHDESLVVSLACIIYWNGFFFFNLVTNSITINKRGATLLTQDRKQIWGFPQRNCQRCQWRGWIFYSSSDVVCARACRTSLIISSVGS